MVMSSQGVNLSPDRPSTGDSLQTSIKDLIAQIAGARRTATLVLGVPRVANAAWGAIRPLTIVDRRE
jgi:hypothetical protein